MPGRARWPLSTDRRIFSPLIPNAGAVWVVIGDATGGLVLNASFDKLLTAEESFTNVGFVEELAGARFGAALTSGDFFGIGVSDLAAGAPGKIAGIFVNGSCAQACRPETGAVLVFLD